jgi:hypothetical protein
LDYEVPASFPLMVTLEGIFTKNINGVMLQNYNLKTTRQHLAEDLADLMTDISIRPAARLTHFKKCLRA